MPKRSASRITMTVAFGTSTPTSITVVATSTSSSPRGTRSIVASFSAGGRRPCSSPRRRPASSSCASRSIRLLGRRHLELLALLDQRAHDVRLAAVRHLVAHVGPHLGLQQRAVRPSSSRSACGPAAARRARSRRDRRRRSSPRCAGSASPSSPARRARRRRRLVAQRGALLDAEAVLLVDHDDAEAVERRRPPGSARACRWRCRPCRRRGRPAPRVRSAPVTRLVSSSTRSGRSPNRLPGSGTRDARRAARRTPVACCSASTSVGAISAPWCPPCTAVSSADTATTVLPEPTSPCSSRCIGMRRGEVGARSRRSPAAGRR